MAVSIYTPTNSEVLLSGKSHGQRSLLGCSPWGSLGVRHNWATSLSRFTFLHWRRKWQPTPVFLPGESQGRGSLVGCCLWGRTESDDWRNLASAAATVQKHSLFSTPSPAFIVCRLFDDGHSDQCEVISHWGFDLHFSNNEWWLLSVFTCVY